MKVETVEWNGKTWTRYPEASRSSDRNYFRRAGKLLHREVYRANYGEIPTGWEVHHRDGDTGNNDPANLEAIDPIAHMALHDAQRSPQVRAQLRAKFLETVTPAARNWHRSEEGREWHREHARGTGFGKSGPHSYVCERCGNTFTSTKPNRKVRACSPACRAALRRAEGKDTEDRTCTVCGGIFQAGRYTKTTTCGRECGAKRSADARRGKPQRKRILQGSARTISTFG